MINFEKLDRLKKRLDEQRPLPAEVVSNLHEDLALRWTYHSNAIEGNTLTLKETRVALEGITVGGKTLREHFEAINHRDAIAYVEAVAQNAEPFTLGMIRSLHAILLKNIDEPEAGAWRRRNADDNNSQGLPPSPLSLSQRARESDLLPSPCGRRAGDEGKNRRNVLIAGAEHTPPDALQVPQLMEEFARWHEGAGKGLHAVELAAKTHADFVKIHPFADGNGRTARLLMNLDLMREGWPPIVLPVESRLAYYEALDAAHVRNDYSGFLTLIGNLAEKAFDPYFFALRLPSEDPQERG